METAPFSLTFMRTLEDDLLVRHVHCLSRDPIVGFSPPVLPSPAACVWQYFVSIGMPSPRLWWPLVSSQLPRSLATRPSPDARAGLLRLAAIARLHSISSGRTRLSLLPRFQSYATCSIVLVREPRPQQRISAPCRPCREAPSVPRIAASRTMRAPDRCCRTPARRRASEHRR